MLAWIVSYSTLLLHTSPPSAGYALNIPFPYINPVYAAKGKNIGKVGRKKGEYFPGVIILTRLFNHFRPFFVSCC